MTDHHVIPQHWAWHNNRCPPPHRVTSNQGLETCRSFFIAIREVKQKSEFLIHSIQKKEKKNSKEDGKISSF